MAVLKKIGSALKWIAAAIISFVVIDRLIDKTGGASVNSNDKEIKKKKVQSAKSRKQAGVSHQRADARRALRSRSRPDFLVRS